MNLGLLDSSVDAHFLPLGDSQVAFYPRGASGRNGYILDSPEMERRLRQSLRRAHGTFTGSLLTVFLLLLGYAWAIPNDGIAPFAVIYSFAYIAAIVLIHAWYALLSKQVAHLPKAQHANSILAACKRMGRSMHPAVLWFVVVLTTGFLLSATYTSITMQSPAPVIIALILPLIAFPFFIALYARYNRH